MKLEVELDATLQKACETLTGSTTRAFEADHLLTMLNDACHPEDPDTVQLSKAQVALLVLLGNLGFSVVASMEIHQMRERGEDPEALKKALEIFLDLIDRNLDSKPDEGKGDQK